MSSSVVTHIEGWLRHAGVWWADDAVAIVAGAPGCSGPALGVRASREVGESELLCRIPKDACLSVRTTSIADLLEAERLAGGLGLTVAVMHERALGPSSKWHGYLTSLPEREYVPVFWSDAELALLAGTEAQGRAEADRAATRDDYEAHVLPMLEKYPGRLRGFSLEAFQAAASLVASRAFGVDEHHGDAMVPLADIFNHKCSVVELAPGYEVGRQAGQDNYGSCSDEEEEVSGSHQGASSSSRSSGGEEDAGLGDEEAVDGGSEQSAGAEDKRAGAAGRHHGNGCCGVANGHACTSDHEHSAGPAAAAPPDGPIARGGGGGEPPQLCGLTEANGLHLRLEIGILDRGDCLEVVAASAIHAGAEVHNTYGELGNAELVHKYGFALPDNPCNAVVLDKAVLLAAASALLGPRQLRARTRLLRDTTSLLEEDAEPFEALPNAHVGPALYVALRALGAPTSEAATWGGIADALALPDGRTVSVAGPVAISGATAAADGGEVAGTGAQEARGQPLCAGALCLLREVVAARLAAYPPASEQHESWDEEAAGRLSSGRAARRAAGLLRRGELALLQALLVAASDQPEARAPAGRRSAPRKRGRA